jgi:hypothetical protein
MINDMSTAAALALVVDIASRWGENEEEGFSRRLTDEDTDEDARAVADDGGADPDDGIEVRDLWRAIKTLQRIVNQKGCEHFDPAVKDGALTTLIDVIVVG